MLPSGSNRRNRNHRRLSTSIPTPGRAERPNASPPRPSLEPIEPRLMLDGTSYVVDSLLDTVASDGVVTLREAIAAANANAAVTSDVLAGSATETDTITFDQAALSAEAGVPVGDPLTITLAGTQLDITDDLDIQGPGALALTIGAGDSSRAVHAAPGATISLAGLSLIASPGTGNGGAIFNEAATLTISEARISGQADFFGGGIYVAGGTLNLLDSVVWGSHAQLGGGISAAAGTVTVVNSTVTGNSANVGGGVFNSGATVTLTNTTVYDNTAASGGGGIQGAATLNNTIVANNRLTPSGTPNDVAGALNVASSHSLIGDATTAGGLTDGVNGNLVGVDPLLTAVVTGAGDILYYVPQTGSPAIDAGSNALAVDPDGAPLATDQAGWARISNGTVDIGSFERPDTPELLLNPASGVEVSEGESVGISVTLLAAPAGPMTISVTKLPGGSTSVNAAAASLEFDPANWDEAQTLTITADWDADQDDEMASFELLAPGIVSSQFDVTVRDRAQYIVDTTDDVVAADGQISLREAIQAADGNVAVNEAPAGSPLYTDLITFDPAIAGGAIVLSEQIVLSGDVLIRGTGPGGSRMTISGGGSSRVISVYTGATVALESLIITGGSAGYNDGGGIYTQGDLSLTYCDVSGNHTQDAGGGIYNTGGSLTLTQTTVSDNWAHEGAAGIYSRLGVLNVSRSTISGNQSDSGGGGGLFTYEGTAVVTDSTVSGNEARDGAGIYNSSSSVLSVINTTIAGNTTTSTYRGAGIFNASLGEASLTNSTVYGNHAGGDGGGIHKSGGSLALNNTIVAGNTGASMNDIWGTVNAGSSHNLIGDAGSSGGLADGVDGNVVGADPMLSPVSDSDGALLYYRPQSGSPAINAGSNVLAVDADGVPLTTDQLGFARIADVTVDIGSIEKTTSPELQITPSSPIRLDEGESVKLSVSLAAAPAGPMTVSVTKQAGAAASVNADVASLNFDETNWDIAQTVTILSDWDPVRLDQAATFVLSAPGALSREVMVMAMDRAHYVVDTDLDVIGPDGQLSLREAIEAANTNAIVNEAMAGSASGNDLITFDAALEGGSIVLGGTQLEITDDLVIRGTGTGASGITIDANRASRVFNIHEGVEARLESLIITGGYLYSSGSSGVGGGLYNYRGNLTVDGCAVWGNRVFSGSYETRGAGIYNYEGSLTVLNSTITGNRASGDPGRGGGIYNWEGTASFTNSTVSHNWAADGGGIYTSGQGTLTLSNTIVTLNEAEENAAIWWEFVANACLLNVDPGFVRNPSPGPDGSWATDDDDPGDLRLAESSVAINLGDNAYAVDQYGLPLETDADGNPRIAHGQVDIGAYEYQGTSPLWEDASTEVTTLANVMDKTDGVTSLREAILYAPILEQDVTFSPALDGGVIALAGRALELRESLVIDASSLNSLTVDAGGQSRVVEIIGEGVEVSLKGLTLTGGFAADDGGAVYNDRALLTLTDTVITGSTAERTGGGIYNSYGTLTLVSSWVSSNEAAYEGGGIRNVFGSVTLAGSAVSGNFAGSRGGGIHTSNGSLTLENSTVSGNESESRGGAIYSTPFDTLTLTNATVAGNTAADLGGGIFGSAGTLTLSNTLIAQNQSTGTDAHDVYVEDLAGDYNLIGDGDDATWLAGEGEHNLAGTTAEPIDARLMPLGMVGGATPLQLLRADSPAIDAGGTSAEPWDQRGPGYARVVGGSVDIGAHEYSDAVEIVTEPVGPLAAQEGRQTSLKVWLSNAPAADLTISATRAAGDPSVTVSPEEVTFTPANWDVPQTLTFQIGFDANNEDGFATFELSGPGTEVRSLTVGALERTVYLVTSLEDNTDVDGLVTIREAVEASNQNFSSPDVPLGRTDRTDLILFDESLSGGAVALWGNPLVITDDLEIRGLGSENLAIDAGYASGVMEISGEDVEVELRDLTLTKGLAYDSSGGGIKNDDATVTLTRCAVTGNEAYYYGGGIYSDHGALTLLDCEVSDNQSSAHDGGGVYASNGPLTVIACDVSGNRADSEGGGVFSDRGPLLILDSNITDNSAPSGGGLYVNYRNLATVRNTTISGNSGGGIYSDYECDLTLINSVVSGNRGVGVYNREESMLSVINSVVVCNRNNGIYSRDSVATITNSTIAGNHVGASHGNGTMTLENAIVALNDSDTSGSGYDAYNSLISVAPGFVRNPDAGTDGIWGTEDDDYGDLRILEATSPAVDAGDNALLPADGYDLDDDGNTSEPLPVDLDGNPRVQGSAVDIGAYEFQEQALPGDANGDGAVTDADYTIWADHYGQANATPAMGDFNGDGAVTDADYTVWADHYGQSLTSRPAMAAAAASADEPADESAAVAAASSALTGVASNGPAGGHYLVDSLLDVVADDGLITLREALEAANTNAPVFDAPAGSDTETDLIEFDPALGGGTIVLDGEELVVSDATEILIPDTGRITLDADGRSRVLSITASAFLKGLVITGGYAAEYAGGGVRVSGADPSTMEDCIIRGNAASGGGGVAKYSAGSLTMDACAVAGNQVWGGEYSGGTGGGVANYASGQSYGLLTMTDCLVIGNRAYATNDYHYSSGGGVYNSGLFSMTNCTVAGNESTRGGGLYTSGADDEMTLINTAVVGNRATGGSESGGDLYGSVELASRFNYVGDTHRTNLENGVNRNIVGGEDARLWMRIEEEAIECIPAPGSALIDAGNTILGTTGTDLLGNPRVVGELIDIGAVEGAQELWPSFSLLSPTEGTEVAADVQTPLPVVADMTMPLETTADVFYDNDGVRNGDELSIAEDISASLLIGSIAWETVWTPAGEWTLSLELDHDFLPLPSTAQATISIVPGTNGGFLVDSLEDVVAEDGVTTLREAIQAASQDNSPHEDEVGVDVVQIDPSLAGGVIYLQGEELRAWGNIRIQAPGPQSITIDADGLSRVFSGNCQKGLLDGFIITGGSEVDGGGIETHGDGPLIIANSRIVGNAAEEMGGGIYAEYGGEVILVNCELSENSAENGGALGYMDGRATAIHTIFSGNTSVHNGGAIVSFNSFGAGLELAYCSLTGNSTDGDGGAIALYTSDAELFGCFIAGNSAYNGGGIAANNLNPFVAGSVVVGNTAVGEGGGLRLRNGTVTNSTIAGNFAGTGGGGIMVRDTYSVDLNNSVVAMNDAPTGTDTQGTFAVESSLIGGDPGFVRNPSAGADGVWGTDDDDWGDLHLAAGSAGIDAGDDSLAVDADGLPLLVDFDGAPRFSGAAVDVGAYEYQALPGDANADGAVTDADYTIWADHYGQTDATLAMGDFNGDGTVTDADYTIWADNYGRTQASEPVLAGQVWQDDDGDGEWDAGEAAVEGAGVYVDLDGDWLYSEGEPRTMSGADGSWAMSDLAPGEYTVRAVPTGVVVPQGAEASSEFSATADPAERVLDGSGLTDGLHSNSWTTMWLTAAGDSSPTLKLDLGEAYAPTGMHVWNYNQATLTERGFASTDVWISLTGIGSPQSDPGQWTRIADDLSLDEATGQSDYAGQYRSLSAAGAYGRYVYFDDVQTFGSTSGAYAGLSEIRFEQSGSPLPASEWAQTFPNESPSVSVVAGQLTDGVNFGMRPVA